MTHAGGARVLGIGTWAALTSAVVACAASARADNRNWSNAAGGSFQDGANWAGGIVPAPADVATFNTSGPAPYTVRFDADAGVFGLDAGNDDLTFDLGGHTFTVGGTQFTTSTRVGFGATHQAKLRVAGGTLATGQAAALATAVGSVAEVTLDGANTRWDANGLMVGHAGDGRLTVSGGALLSTTNATVVIGNQRFATGLMTVSGAATRWETRGTIGVGGPSPLTGSATEFGGRGTLLVLDGAKASTTAGIQAGGGAHSTGTIRVSGASAGARSTLTARAATVGNYGTGSLVVESGALANLDVVGVASTFNSAGDVTVGGSAGGFDAEVVMAGALRIANNQIGLPSAPYSGGVTINSGGALRGATFVTVGNGYTGTGTLSVNGGAFSAGDLHVIRGDVTLSGGTFNVATQTVGMNIFNSTAASTFTQTGGLNAGTPGAGGEARRALLTIDGSAATPAAYNLRGGRLFADVVNKDYFNQTGGTLDGNVTNTGVFTIAGTGPAAAAPGGAPELLGDFVNRGRFAADAGPVHLGHSFQDSTGAVRVADGVALEVGGDFRTDATSGAAWETGGALLRFVGATPGNHVMSVSGADRGPSPEGLVTNFAWRSLHLDAGQRLALDSLAPGRALYVDELVLDGGLAQIADLSATGVGGARLYYNPLASENAYLNGQTYVIAGGGAVIPVPEPAAAVMATASAAWAATRRRRSA